MKELDEFIDQALLNNMAQRDIIHGGDWGHPEGLNSAATSTSSPGYAPQMPVVAVTIVIFK